MMAAEALGAPHEQGRIDDALAGYEVPPGTPLAPGPAAAWDTWDWWLVRNFAAMRDPNTPAHRHGWRVSRRADVAFCRCGTVRVGGPGPNARYHLVWRGV